MMKQLENDRLELKKSKLLLKEKKSEREKQLLVPDMTTMNYERQLKKLATKGGNYFIN